MHEVVGISFDKGNRIYFFLRNNLDINKGDLLVVETERGQQICTAVTDIVEIPDSKVVTPLKSVLRIATPLGRGRCSTSAHDRATNRRSHQKRKPSSHASTV